MSQYETIMKTKDSSILGYIGAALFGFMMQLVLHLTLAGQSATAFGIIMVYTLIITTLEYRCKERDCKFGCQLNEFWLTLEKLVKNKLNIQ